MFALKQAELGSTAWGGVRMPYPIWPIPSVKPGWRLIHSICADLRLPAPPAFFLLTALLVVLA